MSTDIVWHNAQSGEIQLWLAERERVVGRRTVVAEDGQPIMIGPPWRIAAAADFDRDGRSDLLWHNADTGESQLWLMDAHRIRSRRTVLGENGSPARVGPPWRIVGAGDFNRQGWGDILWHNDASNESQLWMLAEHRVIARATVVGENNAPAFVGLPWRIVGCGDFNRDSGTDILWHNDVTNETQVWLMERHRVGGRATVLFEDGKPAFVGLPWSIVSTGDLDDDRHADIIWHNDATGETQAWLMDMHRVRGRATVLGEDGKPAFVGPPWSIFGAGAFKPEATPVLAGTADPCLENFNNQKRWRFCVKCEGLFFDGYQAKGRCAAGGPHQAAGFMFVLAHGLAETVNTQGAWRFCHKCQGMFFDGTPDKGRCAAGGCHQPAGHEFILRHDVAETSNDQGAWRFCDRCRGLFFDGVANKGTCAAGGGHRAAGFDFVLPHDIVAPFVFKARLDSGGLAAIGGDVTVTVNLDGSVRWQGAFHDSGADNYDYNVTAAVRTPSGRVIALTHSGHVSGTFSSGDRDDRWDETRPLPAALVARLGELSRATLETHFEYESAIGATFETLAGWMLKWAVGTVLAPVGAVVFIGLELGSLIGTGSLVPGARMASGILWMAGPSNMLFAIAADGIAALGSRTRDITQEEYDWANLQVFEGALPPRDRLVLTDTIGAGSRAFTFPRFDGKITLNMGPSAFDDPRAYKGEGDATGTRGRTFIHELVHACQIHHTPMDVSLLADALSSKLCELEGDDPYSYGLAGGDYTHLNLEQQAQIVSDWFVGFSSKAGTEHTRIAKDINSPYFQYIAGNVRVGVF
ncbi:MAG: hypothetical protein ABJD97_01600 [Betaproteobacteria bacterium]